MSTLQQSIQQRRTADPAGLVCVSTGAPTSGLVIATWQGEGWVLPWSYLVAARVEGTDTEELLVLSFTSHTVTVQGRHLRPVLADIAMFRVNSFRDLPAEYGAQFPDDAPFIFHIEVRALMPNGPADNAIQRTSGKGFS